LMIRQHCGAKLTTLNVAAAMPRIEAVTWRDYAGARAKNL
jgi:hypothetical protein